MLLLAVIFARLLEELFSGVLLGFLIVRRSKCAQDDRVAVTERLKHWMSTV